VTDVICISKPAVARTPIGTALTPGCKFDFSTFPDGEPDYLSAELLSFTDLAPSASLEQIQSLIHPDDLARLIFWNAGEAAVRAIEIKIRMRGGDTAYQWFRMRAKPVGDGEGRRWVGSLTPGRHPRDFQTAEPCAGALANTLAGVEGCSLEIGPDFRVAGLTERAAAWIGRAEGRLLGVDYRRRGLLPAWLVAAINSSCAAGGALRGDAQWDSSRQTRIQYEIQPSAQGLSVHLRMAPDPQDDDAAAELLEGLSKVVSAGMALVDDAGAIVAVNPAWQAGACSGLPGTSLVEHCRATIPDLDEAALRAVLAGETLQAFSQAYSVAAGSGRLMRRLRVTRVRVAAVEHVLATQEDLPTSAPAAEATKRVSQDLISAEEGVRRRLAVELHDSTSQSLVAVGLGLVQLRRLLRKLPHAGGVLEEMSKSLQSATHEIRVLCYTMMPAALDRDGLEATVRRFVRGFGARTGIRATFDAELLGDAGDAVTQHTAYRIVQEALLNVHRHAGATKVTVELAIRDGWLNLRVADDGKGIEGLAGGLDSVVLGVGVQGMRSRATELGGVFEIACPGVGTVVSASLPLGRPIAGYAIPA
jgi:signal transduction histidine kinase